MDSSTFFSQMALDLHDEPTAERTIERIADYARIATSCDDAGIMLVHARNQIETAAATSPAGRRVAQPADHPRRGPVPRRDRG